MDVRKRRIYGPGERAPTPGERLRALAAEAVQLATEVITELSEQSRPSKPTSTGGNFKRPIDSLETQGHGSRPAHAPAPPAPAARASTLDFDWLEPSPPQTSEVKPAEDSRLESRPPLQLLAEQLGPDRTGPMQDLPEDLPVPARASLDRYMGPDWLKLNRFCRTGYVDPDETRESLEAQMAELGDAIQRMPRYEPEGVPLARWIVELPPGRLEEIEANVGKVMVLDEAAMSFSANPVEAGHWSDFRDFGGHTVKFLLAPAEKSEGRDVRRIRFRENEILFPPQTPFRVRSVTHDVFFEKPEYVFDREGNKRPNTKTIIELEEVVPLSARLR